MQQVAALLLKIFSTLKQVRATIISSRFIKGPANVGKRYIHYNTALSFTDFVIHIYKDLGVQSY